jgi:hypothetical protein
MTDQPQDSSQRDKAIRLVDYLIKLAEIRSKPVRNLSKYNKVLWLADIPEAEGCFTRAWAEDNGRDEDEWIEIRNRPEPRVPTVPVQCRDWVDEATLRKTNELPELRRQITRTVKNPDWMEGGEEPESIDVIDSIEDHADVRRAWEVFLEAEWLQWAEAHDAWKKVHDVYVTLFEIHQEQQRSGEDYELILGMGLLSWKLDDRGHEPIHRHVVVANAALDFEPERGSGTFTVRPVADGANLRPELDMLDLEDQPHGAFGTAKRGLEAAEDDPWRQSTVQGILRGFIHAIDPSGTYEEGPTRRTSSGADSVPLMEYAPALILRKRSSKGLTNVLESIRQQIAEGGALPPAMAHLAEIDPDAEPLQGDSERGPSRYDPEEVYFPKRATNLQRRILTEFKSSQAVVVQGASGNRQITHDRQSHQSSAGNG